MAPAFVSSLLSGFSASKKTKRHDGDALQVKPCASLSASVPASFAYTPSTPSAKQSMSQPISFPSTPPRSSPQQTRSSPLVERERRGSLRRTLSRLSLGGSHSPSGTTNSGSPGGGHGRKDSNELRQPHYLLRRLQQEELERSGTAGWTTSSPSGSPSKSAKGRAAQTDVDTSAKYAELAQLIGIIENSGSPRSSPRVIPVPCSSSSSKVDKPSPPSPSPARKLLKPRRSLPLLSSFSTLPETHVSDETLIPKPRQRLRTSIPFPLTYKLAPIRPAERKTEEKPKVSYKVRPSISYPILIDPETLPRSRHASIENMRMYSWSNYGADDEDDERTIRANTTYSTEEGTIVPDVAEIDSFDDLIYAFPSPTPSKEGSPVSLLSFSSLPQLDSSDDASSSSSSSCSTISTPVGTPDGFSFTPIFTADSMVRFEDDSMKRYALYDSHACQGLATVDEVLEKEDGQKRIPALPHRMDEFAAPTARLFPTTCIRHERSRGFTTLSTISSISGFSFASFANRLLVEDQPECRAPFYLEDDRLYWPQVLAH